MIREARVGKSKSQGYLRDLIDKGYQEAGGGPDAEVFIVRTNLSDESRPTSLQSALLTLGGDLPISADITHKRDFVALVRHLSVVNSGGYVLFVRNADGSGLPDFLFQPQEQTNRSTEQRDRGRLSLLLEFADAGSGPPDYTNGFVTSAPKPGDGEGFLADAGLEALTIKTAPGTMRFKVIRQTPETLMHSATSGASGSRSRYMRPQDVHVQVWDSVARELNFLPDSLSKTEAVQVHDGVHDRLLELGLYEVDLEDRFGMLEYAFGGNDYDDLAFADCLPVGPTEQPEDTETGEPEAGPAGSLADTWRYDILLPVYKLFNENTNKTEDERQRYGGVGKPATLQVNFRDVYGNRIEDALKSCPVTPTYFDPLLGFGDWPSMQAKYGCADEPTTIDISLNFDPKRYFTDPNLTSPVPRLASIRDPERRERLAKRAEELGDIASNAVSAYRTVLNQLTDRPNTRFGITCDLASNPDRLFDFSGSERDSLISPLTKSDLDAGSLV